jgi:hypothetical protein
VPARACVLLPLFCLPFALTAQNGYINGPSFSVSPSFARGLPYTATYENKRVQTLADGTAITTTYKMKEARDSQGRTFHEVTNPMPDGTESTHVFVNDPVDHVLLDWSSGSNRAVVTHLADGAQPVEIPNPPHTKRPVRPMAQHNIQRESLGTKTMFGVVAEGHRRTEVIPTGEVGNDRPITIVTESWRSPDLNITLSNTTDDPRMGHSTNEVTALDRVEPDPALFKPPAGYEVEDRQHPQ